MVQCLAASLVKEVAPSTELRKRFGHLDERWEEFKRDYANELGENPAVGDLIEIIGNRGRVTLVYSATQNNKEMNSPAILNALWQFHPQGQNLHDIPDL